MSELAKQLIQKEKEERTGQLDLGCCGLTDLEAQVPELFELTWLEDLTLSNEWWDKDSRKWIYSINRGSNNQIDILPKDFPKLKNLKKLRMGGGRHYSWKSKDITILKEMTSLQSLDLNSNQISDIRFLEGMKSLCSLNLINNQISDIQFLKALQNLQYLNLISNQISDIRFLKELKNLQYLNLINNQISDIRFLKELKNLQYLNLSENPISDIRFLAELENLQSLNIRFNKIHNIRFLVKLKNLLALDLSQNPISDIRFLAELKNLQTLKLRSIQIKDISFLKDLKNLTSLNLSSNQITDIRFLKGLKKLTSLNLSANKIQDIRFLEGIVQLTSLNLSENQVNGVRYLKRMINLTSLNLSGNKIQDIRFLEGMEQLTSLYLGGNKIEDIRSLEGMNKLNSLDFSGNKIQDIRYLKSLNNLTSLNLSGNKIQDIRFLGNLISLTSLYLAGNQITNIHFLKGLKHLNSLDLAGNKIQDTRFLEKLTNLTSLNLEGNKIQDTRFLEKLTNLSSLNLEGNKIQDIRFLEKLADLNSLNLGRNQIRDIRFLEKLRNLSSLNLSRNQITDYSFLEGLKNLISLNLGGGKITNIHFLKELKKLTSLNLEGNHIQDTHFLEELTHLSKLNLNGNQINNISFLKNLRNLYSLQLGHNQINYIEVIKQLPQLKKLSLIGNPTKDIPTELLYDGNCLPNVKAWWAETKDPEQTQPNCYIKLLLTGNGNTGKSTLFHALKEGKCEKEISSTHGIMLENWFCEEEPSVDFVIWDFGGQEIYHGTHRLFMSSKAIQLILTEPESEKSAREHKTIADRITGESIREQALPYWIGITQQLSPNSELIVVQNKKDLYPERFQPAYQEAAEANLEYYQVSAKKGNGMKLLRMAIHERAINLHSYGIMMPQSWLFVRQYFLENLQKPNKERERQLSKQEFFRRCKEEYGVLEAAIEPLLKLLYRTGILYYNEEYLKETIIADQRWALEAIYKPLKRGSLFYDLLREETFGKIRVKHLFREFGEAYTSKEKWLFLHFMRSCGLCFPMKERKYFTQETEDTYYVFPEFLSQEKSESAHLLWESRSRKVQYFRRKYKYLNYYHIQSFIAQLGQKTRMDHIWRNGILIQTEEGDFQVYADYQEDAIIIEIEENASTKWLPQIIEAWEDLDHQQESKDWEVSENGTDYTPTEIKSFVHHEFSLAERMEKVGHKTEKNTLADRLPDVEQDRPLQLVISYASQDREAVKDLKKHLSALRKEGKIEFWYDQNLDGRTNWDATIQERFEEADGFVVFVSPDYVNYDEKKYIHKYEVPIMQKRQEEFQIPVYCITVYSVDYGSQLGQFLYFRDKKAIPDSHEKNKRAEFFNAFVEEVIKNKFLKHQPR